MKKTEAKKPKNLRLYRETLQALTSSDAQKVVGGGDSDGGNGGMSCETGRPCIICTQ